MKFFNFKKKKEFDGRTLPILERTVFSTIFHAQFPKESQEIFDSMGLLPTINFVSSEYIKTISDATRAAKAVFAALDMPFSKEQPHIRSRYGVYAGIMPHIYKLAENHLAACLYFFANKGAIAPYIGIPQGFEWESGYSDFPHMIDFLETQIDDQLQILSLCHEIRPLIVAEIVLVKERCYEDVLLALSVLLTKLSEISTPEALNSLSAEKPFNHYLVNQDCQEIKRAYIGCQIIPPKVPKKHVTLHIDDNFKLDMENSDFLDFLMKEPDASPIFVRRVKKKDSPEELYNESPEEL